MYFLDRSLKLWSFRTWWSPIWWVLSGQRLKNSGTKYQNSRWDNRKKLKKRIIIFHYKKLQDTVTILSRENEVLRANVNPDVLASLTGNRNLVGGMNSISNQPPDPHPALPPPNQHWASSSLSVHYLVYIYRAKELRIIHAETQTSASYSEDDIQFRQFCWVNQINTRLLD